MKTFKSKYLSFSTCQDCGSEYKVETYRLKKTKYCSFICKQKGTGRNARKIIIKKYRGTGTKTYVKENGRHQHRVVMERVLGRPLLKSEIVHHIDGDKKNNNPLNLQVMTQSEHCKLHFREGVFKRKKVIGLLKCTFENCNDNQRCKGYCQKHYLYNYVRDLL